MGWGNGSRGLVQDRTINVSDHGLLSPRRTVVRSMVVMVLKVVVVGWEKWFGEEHVHSEEGLVGRAVYGMGRGAGAVEEWVLTRSRGSSQERGAANRMSKGPGALRC